MAFPDVQRSSFNMQLKQLFLFGAFLCFLSLSVEGQEVFSGPFSSWANLKTRFGAKGDGKADDTRAFQKALDELTVLTMKFNTGTGAYTTIYLPAGTYCISSTLRLRGKVGISIIGEAPDKTIIKWVGPASDTMFWANGSAYFKIARIGWNANQIPGTKQLAIQWKEKWNDGKTRSFATLNIEISDCRFFGKPEVGIIGGTYQGADDGTGSNDSEILIKRCLFEKCERGILIRGFNALDYWIWDCKFLNCTIGLYCKSGNYHINNSHFFQSNLSDIVNIGGYYMSVRECYSKNSTQFSVDSFNLCSPLKRIFRNNVVVGVKKTAIHYRHFGNLELTDNYFEMANPYSTDPVVNVYSGCGMDKILSVNNNYTAAVPHNIIPTKRITDRGDTKGLRSVRTHRKIDSLPGTPAYLTSKVFDVPMGATSAQIQKLIDLTYAYKGKRPILHFANGEYSIDQPLLIKAGSDLQIVGDGYIYASILRKKNGGFEDKPLLTVQGPSAVSIRDIVIAGDGKENSKTALIHFQGVDQVASQTHLDQIYSLCKNLLRLEKLDYLYLEKSNSFFSDGTYIEAGPLAAAGKGTHKVVFNGGQFVGAVLQNNASLLARDCWWEGMETTPLKLEGSGNFLLDGAMVAPRAMDSGTTIQINKFKGNVALSNMYVVGGLGVEPNNPDLRLFLWNVNFQYMNNPLRFIKPGLNYKLWSSAITFQCFDKRVKGCTNDGIEVPDQVFNVKEPDTYMEEMMGMSRSRLFVPYTKLSANTSNIYMSRVVLQGSPLGITFSK